MAIKTLVVTAFSDIAEAHLLAGLARAGTDMTAVVAPDARHTPVLREAGVRVIELALRGRHDRAGRKVLRDILKDDDFDIIHAFNNKAVANSLAAAKGTRARFIAYRGIEGNVSYWDPASWQTYLHPRVDRVICVADAIRRYFLKISWLGFRQSPSKFITIYKGHDLSWYDAPRSDLQAFGVPEGAFVIGSVANDRPRKGLPVLIEAMQRLADEPDVHLLLVGRMDSPVLRRAIENSPARSRIHVAGFRSDAPSLMSACDVYVLPALKREGLPKTVIEAMAYGVPPIVTDSGGSPELIVHGESGMVVRSGKAEDIADAVRRLRNDAGLRERMGAAARMRIQDSFHVSKTVEETLSVYRDLVQDSMPARGAGTDIRSTRRT